MNISDSSAKILLVDDEPNIVIALEYLLKREGYEVHKAYNGQDALGCLTTLVPDIVILDVMMPGMDGFEVARRLRQMPALEQTKIIFLTAKGTQQDRATGYNSGAEYYMIKPFDNDVFVSTVNEIMAYG